MYVHALNYRTTSSNLRDQTTLSIIEDLLIYVFTATAPVLYYFTFV